MSLLGLQLMYSYLNELTLYAGVLYTQPSWYSFSSWPHSDITSLGCSVILHFLGLAFFYSRDVFGTGLHVHIAHCTVVIFILAHQLHFVTTNFNYL